MGVVAGLAFLGIVFLIWSIRLERQMRPARSACTEPVTAVVASLEERDLERTYGSGRAKRVENYAAYFPVYKYSYGEKEYECASSRGYTHPKIKEGDEVSIFIDPDNPERIYEDFGQNMRTVLLVVALVSVALIVASVVIVCVHLAMGNLREFMLS